LTFLYDEKKRWEDRTRQQNIDRLLRQLEIPERFVTCTLENYQPVAKSQNARCGFARRMPRSGLSA
jgi:DNA replication protein DnaC